jgi:(heptosyl)LPS beta-1,4-glucosyltransferase
MTTLTVVVITKNEADHLAQCLASCAGLADEIVVLDSGSQDETCAIAKSFGANVWVHDHWQGFGRQRQIAQGYVTTEWVLWLDADEQLTPELKSSIKRALATADTRTLFRVSRLSWVFGRFIRHSGWYPDRVVRLYPTALTRYNDSTVHEHVVVPENTTCKTLEGDLLHFTYRDVQHYLVKSAHYAHLWADQREQQGKKTSIMQGLIHGVGCFLKMYVLKVGFLDGKQGFLLAVLSAHSTFVKYADLWVRRQPNKP